jgi:hypothetical protein
VQAIRLAARPVSRHLAMTRAADLPGRDFLGFAIEVDRALASGGPMPAGCVMPEEYRRSAHRVPLVAEARLPDRRKLFEHLCNLRIEERTPFWDGWRAALAKGKIFEDAIGHGYLALAKSAVVAEEKDSWIRTAFLHGWKDVELRLCFARHLKATGAVSAALAQYGVLEALGDPEHAAEARAYYRELADRRAALDAKSRRRLEHLLTRDLAAPGVDFDGFARLESWRVENGQLVVRLAILRPSEKDYDVWIGWDPVVPANWRLLGRITAREDETGTREFLVERKSLGDGLRLSLWGSTEGDSPFNLADYGAAILNRSASIDYSLALEKENQ